MSAMNEFTGLYMCHLPFAKESGNGWNFHENWEALQLGWCLLLLQEAHGNYPIRTRVNARGRFTYISAGGAGRWCPHLESQFTKCSIWEWFLACSISTYPRCCDDGWNCADTSVQILPCPLLYIIMKCYEILNPNRAQFNFYILTMHWFVSCASPAACARACKESLPAWLPPACWRLTTTLWHTQPSAAGPRSLCLLSSISLFL